MWPLPSDLLGQMSTSKILDVAQLLPDKRSQRQFDAEEALRTTTTYIPSPRATLIGTQNLREMIVPIIAISVACQQQPT